MASKIVNLALSVVTAEVEEFLNTNADQVPAQAVSLPALRQTLVTYVLTRIPGLYAKTDDMEHLAVDPKVFYGSNERQRQINTLIQQGIRQIDQDGFGWLTSAHRA